MSAIASRPWHIAVLVPACNEEELLPRCLESILVARSRVCTERSGVTCDVVVAVDSSTDRTREIAECLLLTDCGAVICTNAGSVGCARGLAAEVALLRYAGPRDRCWLANTDADCVVSAHWLERQLDLAEQKVEAVAGIVDVDTFLEHGLRVEERFRAAYKILPDGSHPHVHGANLGVRADAYLKAGGWAGLHTGEDHDLWRRLGDANCRRLSTHALRVMTSGRRVGRAPHGFAEALALYDEAAA
jgi:glycosyltransferase involved in cell wall biosynthesis